MYDIVIIGAGPAGYVAAIRAAQLGFKTACIEKRSTLGGTCLNVGCIPSKALLQTTEHYAFAQKHAEEHGITFSNTQLNFPKMMQRKEEIVKGLTEGIVALFKKNKIDWIHGEATFIDAKNLQTPSGTIQSKYFILATGSEPIALPFLPFDENKILSSTGALSLTKVPEKLIVIGGGVIGIEMASIYHRLGTKVTVIEMLDMLCPGIDSGLMKAMLQIMKREGIEFYLSAKVERG